jgi:hypothetical protein
MFQAHILSVSSVSDLFCKCFIWMFFKNRSGVAHVSMASVAGGQQPTQSFPPAVQLGLFYPLPPLPFLPSISLWQFELGGQTLPNEQTNVE